MAAGVFAVFYGNEVSFGANPGIAVIPSVFVGGLGWVFGYLVVARMRSG